MEMLDAVKLRYPEAQAWAIGDSQGLADQLAQLICDGKKTASCGSLKDYVAESTAAKIGSYNIILRGDGRPACVIRLIAMKIVKFNQITAEFARKEGEGDGSLAYWRTEHRRFFSQTGEFSEDMELVTEEFELIEVMT